MNTKSGATPALGATLDTCRSEANLNSSPKTEIIQAPKEVSCGKSEPSQARSNVTILNDVNLLETVDRISKERGGRPLSQCVENGILLIIWPRLILTVVLRRPRRRHYREKKTKVSILVHRLRKEASI